MHGTNQLFLRLFAAHDRQRDVQRPRVSDSCRNLSIVYAYMAEKKENGALSLAIADISRYKQSEGSMSHANAWY